MGAQGLVLYQSVKGMSRSDCANNQWQTPTGVLNTIFGQLGGRVSYTECSDTSPFLSTNRSLGELMQLGSALQFRFEFQGRIGDMKNAIRCHHLAIVLATDGHSEKPALLSTLGSLYTRRFERLGDLSDVVKAIKYQTEAVLLTPENHMSKPALLGTLGKLYRQRFEYLGGIADIDEAIKYQLRGMMLTPDGDMDMPVHLNGLGSSYRRRFKSSGQLSDIRKAIEYQTQAVLLAPEPYALNNLGNSYLDQFYILGQLEDIDKAIGCITQAVQLTPDGDNQKPSWLTNLGNSYRYRFRRLGEISDISKAIDLYSQVVTRTPDGHLYQPGRLSNLGVSYLSRFKRLGELSDVDNAIKYQGQAVLCTPENHAERADRLNSLGDSYWERFQRLGQLEDIDKAIESRSGAVLLAPDEPDQISNLGALFYRRSQLFGDPEDAHRAIHYNTQALLLTPDGHAEKPDRLNNLGSSYLDRFERLGELADLNGALECLTQAVLFTPDGSGSLPVYLNNLGSSHRRKFEGHDEIEDIQKAIECQARAVLIAPDKHAEKPLFLDNLGGSYWSRFERLGQLADIDKAIEVQSQAVLLTSDDHSEKPCRLYNLGSSYKRRFERQNKASDIEAATNVFEQTAQLPVINPGVQFRSAREWAKCSSLLGVSAELAYRRVMELVPRLIWLGTTVDQRYKLMAEIGDVAMEAAAWAISIQAYDLAIEWLEEGRSIVWGQLLQLQASFEDLSAADPALSDSLKEIGIELAYAGGRSLATSASTGSALHTECYTRHHHHLANKWNQLLEQARLLPGSHDLMRPRKAKELMNAAKEGPVVVINVHSSRCDALIILPNNNGIAHVPLERFSPEKATNARTRLVSLIAHRGSRIGGFKRLQRTPKPEQTYKTLLATLWSDVVKPVLEYLGYMRKLPIEELPRITWCTTGSLSFLPLHAAGCYDEREPQPSAFDLVVSSYTPTLGALIHSAPLRPCSRILAVGQEFTKGYVNLPNTVRELVTIKSCAQKRCYLQLDGNNATVEAVLEAMEECDWVHLACHATQNKEDPAQSAFHLHDGDLTLSTITRRSFKNKGLAFLSACQTATGDEKIPDEAVHLAAGMLMAGYPSVIATMWSINDEDAPEVAQHVYADLLGDGRKSCKGTARALHKAVVELRGKVQESSFGQWVPFIHMGL